MSYSNDFSYYILEELFAAYFKARKRKRRTVNAIAFEKDMEHNIFRLHEDIINHRYEVSRGIAFINEKPVKREIFAADFRDRVVHHLIYRFLAPYCERQFIHDSYSCRKGKGTLFGIHRVQTFMRRVSDNYQKPAYVLKLDIKGYFMQMDRGILENQVMWLIDRYAHEMWEELAKLLRYLCSIIIRHDPTKNSFIKGLWSDWVWLPKDKSLFFSGPNKWMPIGNLTSQLFSNIYLDPMDKYIRHTLGFQYYGRYVDDFVILSQDKQVLLDAGQKIDRFVQAHLHIKVHPKKKYLQPVYHGVKFLWAYILPYRTYIEKRTKRNLDLEMRKLGFLQKVSKETLQSYFGLLSHYNTYRLLTKLRKSLLSYWYKTAYNVNGVLALGL